MTSPRKIWQWLQQGLAVLAMALLLSMIAHKAHHDLSIIAEKHSGAEFWWAVGRYVIGNIAGGKGP